MEGHVLLGAPLAVAPSLDTIPGSPAPTPSLHEPEEPPPSPSIEAGPSDLTSDGGSRRSSTSVLPIAGSYFPAPSTSLPGQHSTSGASTPGERLRPFPLAIPSGTLENSIFSPDPEQGPSREDPRGQGRSFTFPLKPAFILNTPRRRRREGSGDSLVDEPLGFSGELIRESSDSVKVLERPMPGRRRSSTFSTNTSKPTDSRGESRRASLAVAITPTRSFKAFRRRRASISLAPAEAEYLVDEMPHWPAMVRQEERRISPSANNLPFSYQQPADSEYTLESVSTVATVRPLAVSPRKSSLTAALEAHVQSGRLGLSDVPGSLSKQPIEVIIPDDMVIPHEPPPRRSSLDYGSRVIFELKPSYDSDAQHTTILHTDVRSILSTSHTGTDTSASADTYSPSQSSKEHPLSSASTSLSRSAKSGKEGSEEHDGTLSAVRLQRSLEWEARQNRHRMRLERRRMILLELVETEVAYAEDLKNLVQVYLPQLYALPSLSERSADLVARNSAELLDVHTQLAAKMVDVLKKEGLSYELQPELLISRKFERISRRLAALFVDEVSLGDLV